MGIDSITHMGIDSIAHMGIVSKTNMGIELMAHMGIDFTTHLGVQSMTPVGIHCGNILVHCQEIYQYGRHAVYSGVEISLTSLTSTRARSVS